MQNLRSDECGLISFWHSNFMCAWYTRTVRRIFTMGGRLEVLWLISHNDKALMNRASFE